MPPKTPIWKLENHTLGKHLVLENYMNAWLPIMRATNNRVLFIDAFAGPGIYEGGQLGSPIIALQALMEHSAKGGMRGEIIYIFIEKDSERCKQLQTELEKLNIPDNCRHHIFNSTFDETLTQVLDDIEEQNKRLAPSFVMIDPFGVSGTPMKTVARILNNPKSEVYISFIYRDINRFRDNASFKPHLNELFGCDDWQQGISMPESEERKTFLFNLYKSQLKVAGAKYVLHFELYEGNELVYAIFFGTKNLEGCDKMKQAIWKVVPFGDYRFRGSHLGQLTFGNDILDTTALVAALHSEFTDREWVSIEEVEDFVKSDKTDFHSAHLKTLTLKPMEDRGEIEVQPGSRNKRGTYPGGTKLRMVNSPKQNTTVSRQDTQGQLF